MSSVVTFSDLSITAFDDDDFRTDFEASFRARVAAEASVEPDAIVINSITAGSVAVDSTVIFPADTQQASMSNFAALIEARPDIMFQSDTAFSSFGAVASSVVSTGTVEVILAPPPPGPSPPVQGADGTSEATWETPLESSDYLDLELTAEVGEGIRFKYPPAHDVYMLASRWHWEECDFEDSILVGSSTQGGSSDGLVYTVLPDNDKRVIYFASSMGSDCSNGLKVRITIGDFTHSDLLEATQLVEAGEYNFNTIERIWCAEQHCPDAALSYYRGDEVKAAERCKCDSRNLLGFVYRKLTMPRYERSEKYYMEALEECPGHCEARSYLGELYLQTDNKTAALETFDTLVETCGAEHASVTSLVGFWEEKGWPCHPLSDSEECAGDDEPSMASPPVTEPLSPSSPSTPSTVDDDLSSSVPVGIWETSLDSPDYLDLKLTSEVGEGIRFDYPPAHDVYMLASRWHWEECDFEDSILVGSSTQGGSPDGLVYTVLPENDKRVIYFASSMGSDCSNGLKVRITIGDFAHSDLLEATQLVEAGEYNFNTIERIWCAEQHCPDAALSYYRGDEAQGCREVQV